MKWTIFIENSPGGTLEIRGSLHMSHRPDAQLKLKHGSGWVGYVVNRANEKLRKGEHPRGSVGRPLAVDLTNEETQSRKKVYKGLSDFERELIQYIRFIISTPIFLPIGWPGQEFHCIGAVSAHSALLPKVIQELAEEDEKNEYDVDKEHQIRRILRDLAQNCAIFISKTRMRQDRQR